MSAAGPDHEAGTPPWLRADEKATPLWLRTLYASLPVTAVFVVHGGVHDLHPIQVDGEVRPDTTINAIWQALRGCGFDALLSFDPLNGLSVQRLVDGWNPARVAEALGSRTKAKLVHNLLQDPAERALQASEDPAALDVSFLGMDAIAQAVAQCDDAAMGLVIDCSSQLRNDQSEDDPGLRPLMLASLMLANAHVAVDGQSVRFQRPGQRSQVRHPIVWLVDRPDDLPSWLTHGDGIRQIPNVDTRTRVAELLVRPVVPPDQFAAVAARFADATEGFTTRGMFEAVRLAAGTSSVATNIEGAVRTYREGLSENPWQGSRLREELLKGDAALWKRVLGQDEAVERVLDILKRPWASPAPTSASRPTLPAACCTSPARPASGRPRLPKPSPNWSSPTNGRCCGSTCPSSRTIMPRSGWSVPARLRRIRLRRRADQRDPAAAALDRAVRRDGQGRTRGL